MAPPVRGRGRGGTIPFSKPRPAMGENDMVPDKQMSEEEKEYFYGGTIIPKNVRFRPTTVNCITLEIWHGGIFVKEPPRVDYINGQCETLKDWDVDEISSLELVKVVKHLGYASFKVWYRHPALGIFSGLRPFNEDKDVLSFLKDVKGHEEVEFYIEHLIEPIEDVLVKEGTAGEVDSDCEVAEVEKESLVGEVVVEVINSGEYERHYVVDEEVRQPGVDVVERETEVVEEETEAVVGEIGRDKETVVGEEETHDVVDEVERETVVGDEAGGDGYFDEDSQDEEYAAGSEEEVSSEVSLDDPDYDEMWDWTNVLPDYTNNGEHVVGNNSYSHEAGGNGEEGLGHGASASRNPLPTSFDDFDDEDGCSEDLESPPPSDSDDEVERRKFPKFKLGEEGEEIKFELGQIFTTKALLISAVKEYALKYKKNVTLKKNDRKRVVVNCVKGCPFYIRAAKYEEHTYFQIVTYTGDHTCHRTSKNRQAKTTLLARKFVFTLRHTPHMKVNALVEEARKRWGVVLTRYQAYRAKVKALEMIQVAIFEQYQNLRSYAQELLRSNPNSTVKIRSIMGADGPVFERMYVCFHGCKMAFATTCRPLIGLDGCFLKGVYGGQLLTAVGKDGNNQMLPIAFAVVEAETKDSWGWFVELLLQDLNGIENKAWSFISDQQKGLVPTLQLLDPNVDHRLCVKHLYGNWRKKYPGEEMKGALWAAARACTTPEFDRAMEKMKTLNEEAWKDMSQIPAKQWSRSAYSTHTRCDLQVNNMCEAFNRAILEYRDKPIISLIEGLKYYMTNRIVKQRDLMLRYGGNICPMIQQKLEVAKKDSDGWICTWNGDAQYALFEVSNSLDKYCVNLAAKECSCRRWDLTGIPCCHAVACMWYNNDNPEDYIHPCYRKSSFLKTYDYIILPSNGPKLWPVSKAPPINPPYMRRAVGRPKKARRKANDEPRNPQKLKRQQTTVKCHRCGEWGHNKRTCIGKTAADRMIPKGGNKEHTQVLHPEQRASSSEATQTEVPQPTQPTQGSQVASTITSTTTQ